MLHIDPNPERAKLDFKDTVLSDFRFLCDFNFRPVKEDPTFVRYESPEVFVNIYHGRASFELGVEIGRLNEPDEKVTLFEIIAYAGAEKAEGLGQHVTFQVSTREGVREFVPKLARLIHKYGMPFLKPSSIAYRDAHDFRVKAGAEYEKQVNLADMRRRAENAWHSKDYLQVIELYRPIGTDLTEVETKRLAYAEQQILSTNEKAGSIKGNIVRKFSS